MINFSHSPTPPLLTYVFPIKFWDECDLGMTKMVGWDLRSLFGWFGRSKNAQTQPLTRQIAGAEVKPLTQREYEHFFTQILAGVDSGWGKIQVQRAFQALDQRASQTDWMAWLRDFGERLLASPTSNPRLAAQLVQFGDLDYGELSAIALDFGTQLLERIPRDYQNVKQVKPEIPAEVEVARQLFEQGIAQFELGNYGSALVLYEEALEQMPNAPEIWYNKGNAMFHLGRNEAAIASYDKAVQLKPNKYEAWNNRGNALFKLERYEEAIQSWDKALEIYPNYAQAWYNRGVALGNMGQLPQAIESYDKVLEIQPENEQTWFNRGLVYGNLGRYEEAIQSWDKAIELKPERYESWFNRGVALEKLNRTMEANASWQRAEELKS
jgi:tetratricopeptide (TPR) repeat protein